MSHPEFLKRTFFVWPVYAILTKKFESKNQIAPVRLTDYTEVEEEQRKNRKEEEACLYGGLLGEQFFHDLWDDNTLADDHQSEGGKI